MNVPVSFRFNLQSSNLSLMMAYQNQHSHIFLVDLTSLGEMKYNRGVRKLPGILKECLDLAVVSAQTLIQCVGIIMTSQVGEVVEWNISE